MLLATIGEHHKGTYDFLSLPTDFKNKCKAFDGKKWEKFNSEKVARLAYARIQGTAALVAHFQNSSLMNEDKRCRPILWHLENSESGGNLAGHVSSSNLNIQVCQSKEMDSPNSTGSTNNGFLRDDVEKQ
ncbi:Hypothetical predicted protein [Olea europaea subsp. europaea]|uniref:Mei2-like C-terminal RNA recognition motif domain-containing protein n=1 Tax=Olea europaea subsp. europaea TaxID=158383 RepID=A0A8S0SUN8_OLEEU|nr:Hypothetical predicted protein [Olea europaea subsp. europaea]